MYLRRENSFSKSRFGRIQRIQSNLCCNVFFFITTLSFKIKNNLFFSDVEKVYVAPCGACRQFIAEFGLDWTCIFVKTNDEYKICQVREILPFAFESSAL